MTALILLAALDLACICPPPTLPTLPAETVTGRVERLRREVREAEHDARMEQLAEVARKVNAGIAKRKRR